MRRRRREGPPEGDAARSGPAARSSILDRVPELSDDQVVKLVPALAEAARADRRTAARFVPPRTGILEETASRRHQFVFGRRGVGKSTLLRKIESAATDSDVEVIFVDIETLRGRPYPDVLIELLIQLLDALENRLASVPRRRVVVRVRRRATLRRIRTLRQALRALLDQPQSAERTIRELSARHTRAGVAGSVDVSIPRTGRVSAGAEHAQAANSRPPARRRSCARRWTGCWTPRC